MSEQDPEDDQQRPSQEELQDAARAVWRKIKVFGALIALFAVAVTIFFGVSAYRGFGIVGIVLVALIVTIVLWLLTKLLEMF